MDYANLAIGGIGVIVLVLGLVELAKKFGITGNGSLALAVILGFGFSALAYFINAGMIPEEAVPWIVGLVQGLGGCLAAAGIYDLGKKFFVNS